MSGRQLVIWDGRFRRESRAGYIKRYDHQRRGAKTVQDRVLVDRGWERMIW